jgi:adenylate cyclase
MSHSRQRLFLFGLIALVSAGLWIGLHAADVLRSLELDSVDARFSIRGTEQPPADLVIVAIDDVTSDELNQRWPFPRSMHANVIDRIAADRPKAIAYDIEFIGLGPLKDDLALANAIARARGRVVLAATETDRRGRTNLLGGGDPLLKEIGARPASALFPVDAGATRRMKFQVNKLKTFGVATAEVADGETLKPSLFGGHPEWIDYYGPPGTIRTVSFSRVLRDRLPKGFFRGKVVVVGPTAPSLQDLRATSTTGDDLMPGAEIQANAIQTVRRGLPLSELPGWLDVVLIAVLGVLGPLAMLTFGPLRATLAALLVAAGYAVAAQLAFNGGDIVPFVHPVGALALGLVGSLAVETVIGAIDRAVTRDRFARFVPKAVVDDVLARTDDDLRLGGEQRVATVLFSDVRGFTTFSESREPGEVIEILNRYLAEMTSAIMGHGGTLVSYMGDGIMAVFGAPIPQDDHADRALAAAREMLGVRLEGFNAWMRERGSAEGFRMGVGLNSGSVMSGMVGSDERLEYTTIGDTTNTAARLEGMTKETPHQLFVSDSTRESLTADPGDLVFVDEFPVRGREATIRVFTISDGGGPQRPAVPGAAPEASAPSG